jgi:hypothetical protein
MTAGGVTGILDLSDANALFFTTANGTMSIDSAGIHMQSVGCTFQVDISMATLTALNSTAPTKRAAARSLVSTDVVVPPVLFTVMLEIFDACGNIVPKLEPLPGVSINGTACNTLVPPGTGFYQFDCLYVFGNEKQCEANAAITFGNMGTNDKWTIFAAQLGAILALLGGLAGVAAAIPGLAATAAIWLAFGGAFAYAGLVAALWGAVLAQLLADKDAIMTGACTKKYGIDPPQPLVFTAQTNTASEKFTLDTLTTVPVSTLKGSAPELDYPVLLQTEAGTFSPPVPGNLLVNGNFDLGACTASSTFSPWTAYFEYPDNTAQRMWFGTGGIDGKAGCSTGIPGDECM